MRLELFAGAGLAAAVAGAALLSLHSHPREARREVDHVPADGVVIPTMSFDERAVSYSSLSTYEPGLPIRSYFSDFFPYDCIDGDTDALEAMYPEQPWRTWRKLRDSCRTQVPILCDSQVGDSNYGKVQLANQGIVLPLLTSESRFSCGLVTTAHGWDDLRKKLPAGQNPLFSCLVVMGTASEDYSSILNTKLLGETAYSNLMNFFQSRNHALGKVPGPHSPEPYFNYLEFFDSDRIGSVVEALSDGTFGMSGSETTDLEYEDVSNQICASFTRLDDKLATFEDIRKLTSTAALKATCDLGVAVCAGPVSGEVNDQKRCAYYSTDELGGEGDVYDFRDLRNGKGRVKHYGTSFRGLSGAGHYCLRAGGEPIPFGMSVGIISGLSGVDKEEYNQFLSRYIMQGRRETGQHVVVQHLGSLADFEDFRREIGLK